MLARAIDRIESKLAPHARSVSIVAAVWFWIGVAVQARFVPLPALPRELEAAIFWGGIFVNAAWWGFLRPAIQRRRATRGAAGGPGR